MQQNPEQRQFINAAPVLKLNNDVLITAEVVALDCECTAHTIGYR
jgi:hypothetical protein